MTKFYMDLTDEVLKAEIERLESLISAIKYDGIMRSGFQEILDKYQKELYLREKLSQ